MNQLVSIADISVVNNFNDAFCNSYSWCYTLYEEYFGLYIVIAHENTVG
jgi:hypothetical protein